MWNDRYAFRLSDAAVFDPASATATAIGLTVAGGATGALGTLAGGSAAKQAGLMQQQADEFRAKQAEQNASLAIAGGQVKAADTTLKANAAESTSTARAAASGVDAGSGSAATNVGEIAKRGSYQALMDLHAGQVQATGFENEAQGVRYGGDLSELEGEEKQKASYLAAGGQALSTAGSGFSTYGKLTYPTPTGSSGTTV